MGDWRLESLTVHNSVLLLVDYQPAMFQGVGSGDRDAIHTAAVATATTAKILGVPVVLTTIWPEGNGKCIKEIAGLFPSQEVIARKVPGFDALDDERVMQAVKNTGRKKLVLSGLWTSMCFAFTALHGLRDGFEVYGLIDAGGDATPPAHEYGVQRMVVTLLPVWNPGSGLPSALTTSASVPAQSLLLVTRDLR
jgi:nicotinamidase-related amidase